MNKPFKLLPICSVLFKVFAWLFLLLMLASVVGILMVQGVPQAAKLQNLLSYAVTGIVLFVTFYALGEMVRLLLVIEAQTRKETLS